MILNMLSLRNDFSKLTLLRSLYTTKIATAFGLLSTESTVA